MEKVAGLQTGGNAETMQQKDNQSEKKVPGKKAAPPETKQVYEPKTRPGAGSIKHADRLVSARHQRLPGCNAPGMKLLK